MAINPAAQHPKYQERVAQWAMLRDVIEGGHRVKERGSTYLPRPSGMRDQDFKKYLTRAWFYEGTRRTWAALAGLVSRSSPKVDGVDVETLDEVTSERESFAALDARMKAELILTGRSVALVDYAESGPFVVLYPTEAVIGWKVSRGVLESVRFLEVEEYEEDFETKHRESVLHLFLRDGFAFSQRYEKTKDEKGKDGWQVLPEIALVSRTGIPFDFISCVSVIPGELSFNPPTPPMLAIADAAIAHYRNSADHEHSLHWSALPTAWAAGFALGEGETLEIGGMAAWVTPEPAAKAGYLEISGSACDRISAAMDKKIEAMATLGARMLEARPKGVESSEAIRLRRSGEESFLSQVSSAVKEALEKILYWRGRWNGEELSPSVTQAKDFDVQAIGAQELQALVGAMQAGLMSFETFFSVLHRGEIYPDGWTADEERLAIANNPIPGLPDATAPARGTART